MKIVDMKDYIPSIAELQTGELGYNLVDDDLSLKVANDTVIRILTSLAKKVYVDDAIAAIPPVRTGYKNILINGDFRINQRGVTGWDSVTAGDYGYDRWKKKDDDTISQTIEDGNFAKGAKYTLSYDMPDVERVVKHLTSPNHLPAWAIEVPIAATNIQLEIGDTATDYELRPVGLELSLCQRYYQVVNGNHTGNMYLNFATSKATGQGGYFSTPMRDKPTGNELESPEYWNCHHDATEPTNEPTAPDNMSWIKRCTIGGATAYSMWGGKYEFDAEISIVIVTPTAAGTTATGDAVLVTVSGDIIGSLELENWSVLSDAGTHTISTIEYADNIVTLHLGEKIIIGEANIKVSHAEQVETNIAEFADYAVTNDVVKPKFDSTWNIPSDGYNFELPIRDDASNNITIDWGDGNETTHTGAGYPTHTYATAGVYRIKVDGTLVGWKTLGRKDRDKIVTIDSLGELGYTNMEYGFYTSTIATSFKNGVSDTSGVTNMFCAFRGLTCPVDLNGFKISDVCTNVQFMFRDATNINLNGIDTSGLTTMQHMFFGFAGTADYSKLDTSSVTKMDGMFRTIPNDIDLNGFVIPSSCTNVQFMFKDATGNVNLNGIDTSGLTTMQFMFFGFDGTADYSKLDTSSVTKMDGMFRSISNDIDLNGFVIPASCTYVAFMFHNSNGNINLNGIDTSELTIMNDMFRNFNGTAEFKYLNIGNVTSMLRIFQDHTMTTAVYDDTLISWANQSHKPNITVDFNGAKYTAGGDAEAARTQLINDGWNITDGGAA